MTTKFFENNIPALAKDYRVIVVDPRGQGESSKTMEGNYYKQHGADFAAFFDAMKLEKIHLVAWSWGCLGAWEYMNANGTDRLKSYTCVDNPVKSLVTEEGDWGIMPPKNIAGALKFALHNSAQYAGATIKWMVSRDLTADETKWMAEEIAKTPLSVSYALLADGLTADHTETVEAIAKKIPVMNIVSNGWSEPALKWLAKHSPSAENHVLGNHAMFWEFPDEFNGHLSAFLAKNEK